jgi:hypothetical protein
MYASWAPTSAARGSGRLADRPEVVVLARPGRDRSRAAGSISTPREMGGEMARRLPAVDPRLGARVRRGGADVHGARCGGGWTTGLVARVQLSDAAIVAVAGAP